MIRPLLLTAVVLIAVTYPARCFAQGLNVRELYNGAKVFYQRYKPKSVKVDRRFKTRKVVDNAVVACRKDPKQVGSQLIGALQMHYGVAYPTDLPGRVEAAKESTVADRIEILTMCGRHFNSVNDADTALKFYEAALRLSPRDAVLLREAAAIRGRLGDSTGAVSSLDTALKVDPLDAASSEDLGKQHLARGDHAKAVEALEMAVAGGRRSWGLLNALGDAYRGVGRAGDAAKAYSDALALQEDQPE